jgi:hypothetical protein
VRERGAAFIDTVPSVQHTILKGLEWPVQEVREGWVETGMMEDESRPKVVPGGGLVDPGGKISYSLIEGPLIVTR